MRAGMAAARRGALPMLGVLALVLGTLQCYAPNPKSGTLLCGHNRSCPEGYTCPTGQNSCWKNGETPTGAAGAGGSGGTGTGGTAGTGAGGTGGAGGSGSVDKFIGHWVFTAASMLSITCSDGSSSTKSLAADYVDVTAGTASDLVASYYCDWDLTLGAAGAVASIRPGQSCTSVDSTSGTMFTWHGDSFNFSTADGTTAMLSAMISAEYVDSPTSTTPNATGTCTLRITGTLN